MLAILKWNGLDPANKTWPDFKAHFSEAYDTYLRSGAGTVNINGYHGMANATDIADNDSISSIRESFSTVQVASNANFQVTNDNMLAMSKDLQTVRATLVSTHQQVALLSRAGATKPPAPIGMAGSRAPCSLRYSAPYLHAPTTSSICPSKLPSIPATIYQYPYGHQQGGHGGGRGHAAGRRHRGRSDGAGQSTTPPTVGGRGAPPVYPQAAPPNRGNPPNAYKKWNNWNMCCSCGYNVPY